MTSSDSQATDQDHDEQITWHRAHPVYMITALLRNLRGFIIPLIIVLVGGDPGRGGRRGTLIFFGISAVILLLSGIGGVIQWRFYRYALTPERLLVNSGIIFKQERAIPYERIQSVDLIEAPLDRIFGVARMQVETAAGGASESEVELKAVKRGDAQALRERLLGARRQLKEESETIVSDERAASEQPTSVMASEGEVVRALSLGELLLAGATSGTIGPALAIVGVSIQFADDIVPESWWRRVPWNEITGASTNLRVLAIVVLVVALFAWLLAIGGTLLTYYGFELRRDGEHLVVKYGLLDRRRTTVPIRRLQAVRIEESLLRQPFRLAAVRYDSAGRAGSEEGGTGMLFPMMPRREVESLLRDVAPEFAVDVDEPRLKRVPKRSIPRYIVASTAFSIVVVAAVMTAIWYWQDGLPTWGYLPLFWPPLEIVFGWLGWRDAGWRLDDGVLLLRSRGLERSIVIAPRRRIQHRETTANPLQRRVHLATLHITVASGGLGGRYSLAHLDARNGLEILHALKPRKAMS